jgi:hypothetical protein
MRATVSDSSNGVGQVASASEKIISAIGVSDENVAHLRLLMRKAASELSNSWRWGPEDRADLLVVDADEFVGQMARLRAHATGMRVAIICDPGTKPEGDLALYRPFKLQNVIEALNQVTGVVSNPFQIIPQRQDFYFTDEHESTPVTAREFATPRPVADEVALGLDEMIRGNPLADPFANLKSPKLDDLVSIEDTTGPTRRSDARMDREPEKRDADSAAALNLSPSARRSTGDDHSTHRLRAYLDGDLLGGSAQIAWRDAGVLTLDPKHRVFHSDGELPSLESYCRESSRRSDWRVLTTVEMTQLRGKQVAQPYAKLIWLDVLLHSNGKLAVHLDPGGTYRLKQGFDIGRGYPRYAQIALVMQQPARLHEIAAASHSEMSDVFDLINACEAIGLLEWTPRPSRYADAGGDNAPLSLLQRLRKSFGKS